MDLRHLLNLCTRYCQANLAPPNAIPWLVQAEEHQLGELRVLTLAYVKREFRRIRMVARDTLRILAENPDLTVEVMDVLS